jgi:hypothetical protein
MTAVTFSGRTWDTGHDYTPRAESRSDGGDLPISRRCVRGDHIRCTGEWTQYPDYSGPCECPNPDCPCNPGPAAHVHDLIESATTDTCDYCCKVFRCSCGQSEVRHMASYGCPIGRGETAASAA